MTPRTPRSSLAVQGYTPLGGSQDPPPLPLAAAGLQHGGTPPDTPPSADGAPASPRADAPAPAHAADRGATTPRTPAAGGAPPRAGSRGERGGAAPATPRTPRTPRTPGDTPGLLDNVSNKGGWIQTSVTVSDLTVAGWTQQKQDMFIEAVAATAQVGLSDVCVLSLKEKCGRRLLSIATEITFQVKASSREHAQEVVRDLKSSSLDSMMLQANIRIRPDTARAPDESGGSTPRDKNPYVGTPFRNGCPPAPPSRHAPPSRPTAAAGFVHA
jgi:hypothetical protein